MLVYLREPGSIEQAADVVMFVLREEYYLQRCDPASLKSEQAKTLDASRNIAEVIIAKNRSGPIGRVGLFFDARLTRFTNLESPTQVRGGGVGLDGPVPRAGNLTE